VSSETMILLDEEFASWDESRGVPVSVEEVIGAERAIGVPLSNGYRSFLLRYGSAMVGPLPVYGLSKSKALGDDWSVVEMTLCFRSEQWPGCEVWAVVSMDGSGNPIGLAADGKVWTYDHDAGETLLLAETFEAFLRAKCLKR
jgi:hypothetical protein